MAEQVSSVEIDCTDERATQVLGARLAAGLAQLQQGPVLATLSGDLGAGKTTLVRAILTALGHSGPVPSPTYMLLEPYELAGWSIAHLDFYRLRGAAELEGLGLRDFWSGRRLLLIEWPENAGGGLPSADLAIVIRLDEARRLVRMTAGSPAGQRWLDGLRARIAAGA